MSNEIEEPENIGIRPGCDTRLLGTITTCNHVVHALKAAIDMLEDPDQRDIGITVIKSQIDSLVKRLDEACPGIEEIAAEYLHPRGSVLLEFGKHDDDNAYLNYLVPEGVTMTEPAYIDIEEMLRKTAENIVRDINMYEDNDSYTPGEWIVCEEPNFFDMDGDEYEDCDLSRLGYAKTIQIAIMRKDQ